MSMATKISPETETAAVSAVRTPRGMRPHYIDIIHRFESELRIKVVSTEVDILIALFDSSPMRVADLRGHCSVSSAKFFTVLGQLEQRGIIEKVADPTDGRRRQYRLPQVVRTHIIEVFEKCVETARGIGLTEDARLLAIFEEAQTTISADYDFAFSSSRYSILSSLFRLGDWHPNEGHKHTAISQVTFFAALDHLKAIGAIECYEDPKDRRKKRCRLTVQARRTFADAIRQTLTTMQDHLEAGKAAAALAPVVFLFL